MNELTASDGQAGHGHDWTEQAACRDADPAVFVDPTNDEHVVKALSTCARCPVARDCLDTALAHDQIGDIGIWGGTTPAIRDQIRAGTLTRNDALHLQTGPYRSTGDPTPMVAVTPDEYGDFTDDTGRILITRLPAGDYMTFIDQQPVARTPTLIDACQAAHTEQAHAPDARSRARPPSPALIEMHLDEHGDDVDDSGRILITRVPTEPAYLVFLDNRLHTRSETLNTARAVAQSAIHLEAKARDPATSQCMPVPAAATNRQTTERRPRACITAATRKPEPAVRGR